MELQQQHATQQHSRARAGCGGRSTSPPPFGNLEGPRRGGRSPGHSRPAGWRRPPAAGPAGPPSHVRACARARALKRHAPRPSRGVCAAGRALRLGVRTEGEWVCCSGQTAVINVPPNRSCTENGRSCVALWVYCHVRAIHGATPGSACLPRWATAQITQRCSTVGRPLAPGTLAATCGAGSGGSGRAASAGRRRLVVMITHPRGSSPPEAPSSTAGLQSVQQAAGGLPPSLRRSVTKGA